MTEHWCADLDWGNNEKRKMKNEKNAFPKVICGHRRHLWILIKTPKGSFRTPLAGINRCHNLGGKPFPKMVKFMFFHPQITQMITDVF